MSTEQDNSGTSPEQGRTLEVGGLWWLWLLVIVAMLAMLHPLGVIVAALFVAAIFVGADAMSRNIGVPTYIADIMLATALLLMVLAILLTRFRVRRD